MVLKLHRLDPERFPCDIIDFSDDDLRALSFPAGERGLLWDEVVRGARLAEYDPERFRRIFGKYYAPDVIAEMRAEAQRLDQDGKKNTPRYRELWAKIERALQHPEREER